MKGKRYSEEQIIGILKAHEADTRVTRDKAADRSIRGSRCPRYGIHQGIPIPWLLCHNAMIIIGMVGPPGLESGTKGV